MLTDGTSSLWPSLQTAGGLFQLLGTMQSKYGMQVLAVTSVSACPLLSALML